MGYYTEYNLEIRTGKHKVCDIAKKILENEDVFCGLESPYPSDLQNASTNQNYCLDFIESVKWYEHDEDMRKLSREFPDAVFVLNGIGEDYDDRWISEYKNGAQRDKHAVVTYTEFGEWY